MKENAKDTETVVSDLFLSEDFQYGQDVACLKQFFACLRDQQCLLISEYIRDLWLFSSFQSVNWNASRGRAEDDERLFSMSWSNSQRAVPPRLGKSPGSKGVLLRTASGYEIALAPQHEFRSSQSPQPGVAMLYKPVSICELDRPNIIFYEHFVIWFKRLNKAKMI